MKKILILIGFVTLFVNAKSQEDIKYRLFNPSKENNKESFLFSLYAVIQSEINIFNKFDDTIVWFVSYQNINEEKQLFEFIVRGAYNKKDLEEFAPTHFIRFKNKNIVVKSRENSSYLTNVLKLQTLDEKSYKEIEDKMCVDKLYTIFGIRYYIVNISPKDYKIEFVVNN